MSTSSGRRFVDAIVSRDHDALRACLSPNVDFKGLTPGRLWEADSPDGVHDVVLETWFEEHDRIVDVSEVREGQVADTAHISYRFDLETPGGPHVAEQQAYYREGADGIAHLRIMCSGFRPRTA